MPYKFFDHEADIGVIGQGKTIEASFINAAKAVFSIMCDLKQIESLKKFEFTFAEDDIELALVIWLNLLISAANTHQYFFCKFKLRKQKNTWFGEAYGQPWQSSLTKGVDVKGATLTMLSVKKKNHLWEASCIVDV